MGEMLVTIAPDCGKATGSVWHSTPECYMLSNHGSAFREITEEMVEILGFSKCKHCARFDLLSEDTALVLLVDSLRKAEILNQRHNINNPDTLSLANKFRNMLAANGLHLVLVEEET